MLILLTAPGEIQADPAWLSPNIQIGDCEEMDWRSAAMCRAHYYEQRLDHMREFCHQSISEFEPDEESGCQVARLKDYFAAREAAWDDYGSKLCDLQCHCLGPCGSGHGSCYRDCWVSNLQQRVELLGKEMGQGLETWGCQVPLVERTKTLRTPSFEITLKANCELGFFDCESMVYIGTSKKTGESLALSGSRIRDCDFDAFRCDWRGFAFENEGFLYRVEESGLLTVRRAEDDKLLVSEQGVWQ